jgi:hypothetical protein
MNENTARIAYLLLYNEFEQLTSSELIPASHKKLAPSFANWTQYRYHDLVE